MTIEQVIARIERARSIYEKAIDSDIVKGRVAMCNDIVATLRLEAEFHPKQEQQKLLEGLEEAACEYVEELEKKMKAETGSNFDEDVAYLLTRLYIAGAEWGAEHLRKNKTSIEP